MITRPQRVPTKLLLSIVVFCLSAGLVDTARAQIQITSARTPKYVFVFLADGAGIAHMEITRQYNRIVHNAGLVISDKIMAQGTLGLMTTHAADSLTTDSAAAATAMALGCKAKLGVLGICADGTLAKSAVEIAREKGMRVGLVTNSSVYDASPAAFATHIADRRQYRPILDRYIDIAPDVISGVAESNSRPILTRAVGKPIARISPSPLRVRAIAMSQINKNWTRFEREKCSGSLLSAI
jgi:alkaline phosphatase